MGNVCSCAWSALTRSLFQTCFYQRLDFMTTFPVQWRIPALSTLIILLQAPLSLLVADDAVTPKAIPGVDKVVLLPPSAGNPRNSEGDFVELRDGRLMFVYTHFTGGASDHATARLAARFSSDGGKSWTTVDTPVLDNEAGQNVMSVSLLRLKTGELALFYLAKQSSEDCRPRVRYSTDEAKTWSEPVECVAGTGYYVLNNDRVVPLKNGELVFVTAKHAFDGKRFDGRGDIYFHRSADHGRTWTMVGPIERGDSTLQEPGVIELKDGRLMIFCRTTHGSQYLSFSSDQGQTWTPFAASSIQSPVSPATIERIPSTGDLLLVWNDHSHIAPEFRGKRTPFNAAISRDDGQTWEPAKTLEDNVNGWYCYTAMEFVGDHVVLGHCAGDRRTGGLNTTQITRFPVSWLYDDSK